MGRTLTITLALAVLGFWAPRAKAEGDDFVRVTDGAFALNAGPFRFVGANASVIHGFNERRDHERVLDAIREDGLSVVRILHSASSRRPASPTIRFTPFASANKAGSRIRSSNSTACWSLPRPAACV